MGKISVEQRFTMLARIGEHIDWDSLDTEQVQVGIREAQRAGVEATTFIRNGFRVSINDFFRETGELILPIPALLRPTLEEIYEKFSFVKTIERDTSPTEAVALALGTVFHADERSSITDDEYERRIAPKLNAVLGYQQAVWCAEHQDEFPEFKALLGKVYINFTGLVVVGTISRRLSPCLSEEYGRWKLGWGWFSNKFSPERIAVSSKPR